MDRNDIWQFWVDRGGTFTDVVARAPEGALHTLKLLSEDPGRYADAAVAAMHRLTGTPEGTPLPQSCLRLGTTVATNALLERAGEPTLLAITGGFGDALAIATQDRPDIFARAIHLPEPLYAEVTEIRERIGASGQVLVPLDESAARASLAAARARGISAIAIVLMHAHRNPAHEGTLGRLAAELGFATIALSHQSAAVSRLVARGQTAVIDAYLTPVLARYVVGLESGLGPAVSALYMRSGGSLTPGTGFRGKDAVLSGPAGGIVGLAAVAREEGREQVVGFDMGGTSTDVSWFSGTYERDDDARIAGQRLAVPMMRIHTVAAGGGSVCWFDGARLQVGPRSAGAVPGPACYGRNGPLTVTDCNLILGRLQPAHFPHSFGPTGDQPISLPAAMARMTEILDEIADATGQRMTETAAAEGFLAIAVANMAHAIKAVSLRRGHDVTQAALVSFGGAGGQHACAVADALGMREVICHPLASLLSAWGMGLAERGAAAEETLAVPLVASHAEAIAHSLTRLEAQARQELARQGVAGPLHIQSRLHIRPRSSENTVDVAPGSLAEIAARFASQWQARFGYAATGPLVVETVRVEALEAVAPPAGALSLPTEPAPAPSSASLFAQGTRQSVPLHRREALPAGWEASGPALIVDPVSTLYLAPGWHARIAPSGSCILSRTPDGTLPALSSQDTACDPIRLEIMGALFMAVAEEMGAALQFSASSVNIRERLDFSCALFDAAGNLIANAPHMPVHLGSMGESVRAILARRGRTANGRAPDGRGIRQGDVYALNVPHAGGTHLPDITVVMPVFASEADADPAWFVAARGHHADIGGISPGSMPPSSTTLSEEGIALDNVLLVADGALREAEIRALLAQPPYPARDPDRNLADLSAQIAACTRGAQELRRIAREQGRATVDAYMGHVQAHAEQAVRALLGRLSGGAISLPMDNGAHITVTIAIDPATHSATFDFSGTSAEQADNFNAPLPVVRAAVLYVLRCLIDTAVPMNEGFLRPVRLVVPQGSLLSPSPGRAVVAGNVETSQVLCDALFAALGAMAASQGTMNNFTFGNARHQYYETIAGGAGAGPGFAGAAAVQTHMTNSRLTDPEILESRFPVLVEEFSIRRGSGGAGQWPGGDGTCRRIRFLEPMDAGILANRRTTVPFGLAGGSNGAPGANRVERADGRVEQLDSCAAVPMDAADVFVIETPGGGGYGAPASPSIRKCSIAPPTLYGAKSRPNSG